MLGILCYRHFPCQEKHDAYRYHWALNTTKMILENVIISCNFFLNSLILTQNKSFLILYKIDSITCLKYI